MSQHVIYIFMISLGLLMWNHYSSQRLKHSLTDFLVELKLNIYNILKLINYKVETDHHKLFCNVHHKLQNFGINTISILNHWLFVICILNFKILEQHSNSKIICNNHGHPPPILESKLVVYIANTYIVYDAHCKCFHSLAWIISH